MEGGQDGQDSEDGILSIQVILSNSIVVVAESVSEWIEDVRHDKRDSGDSILSIQGILSNSIVVVAASVSEWTEDVRQDEQDQRIASSSTQSSCRILQ